MNKFVSLKNLMILLVYGTSTVFSMDMEDFISPSPELLMEEAISEGDLEKVTYLIERYKDFPEKLVSKDGKTPLYRAIHYDKKELFNYFIDETVFGTWDWINYASLKTEDRIHYEDNTPLLICIKKNSIFEHDFDVIAKLLSHGADINRQDYDNKGTPLWNICCKRSFGEHLPLVRFLTYSGANRFLSCKNIHDDRGYDKPRGCTPLERAKESGYYEIEAFLAMQDYVNLSLVERLEQESDPIIQENLYARAIFYENYDVLWHIVGLIKQIKKYPTIQHVENDVIKKLLKIGYIKRLNYFMDQGFYCTAEDIKNIKTLIERHIQKESDLQKISAMAYDFYAALASNKRVACLKSFVRNERFNDVVCFCTNEPIRFFSPDTVKSKKRSLRRQLPVAKKTKE